MSFCTYIASDKPLSGSDCLWPLSRGGEDIYTEKVYVAQLVPDLDDFSGVLSYIQSHLQTSEELAARLNVVRQTVSKWEKGQSVLDAEQPCRNYRMDRDHRKMTHRPEAFVL